MQSRIEHQTGDQDKWLFLIVSTNTITGSTVARRTPYGRCWATLTYRSLWGICQRRCIFQGVRGRQDKTLSDYGAISNAILAICVKSRSRSLDVARSPVAKTSLTVRRETASTLNLAASV